MATQQKRTRSEINRGNAAHSTGPRTAGGKARSGRNALTHGLTSSAVVLPHENPDEYTALKTAFEEQHQPGSGLERELLGRMVDCWWRLQRAYRIEAEFLGGREAAIAGEAAMRQESPRLNGDAALATLFTDPQEMSRMRLFLRYLGSAERAWRRASADFENAKKERLSAEAEQSSAAQATFLARMNRYLNAPIPGFFDGDPNLPDGVAPIRHQVVNGTRMPVPDNRPLRNESQNQGKDSLSNHPLVTP